MPWHTMAPLVASLCLAASNADGVLPLYALTTDPGDVPGAPVDFGALPPTATAFYDGTRVGATVESALEYLFGFGGPPSVIAMGYREAGSSEIRNTYFPGTATSLVFRYDAPVSAAGAVLRGVATAGINPSYAVVVTASDAQGASLFSETVEFAEGASAPVFVGVISSAGATIKTIQFSPPGIGGIGCSDLRPGGPAVGACPGDANGDGTVDFLDLNLVLSDYGVSGAGLPGDVDNDGDCDFFDLNLVLGNYGGSC